MTNQIKKKKHASGRDVAGCKATQIDHTILAHRIKSAIRRKKVLRQQMRLDARRRALMASLPHEIYVIDLEGQVIEVCDESTVSQAFRKCKGRKMSDFMPVHVVKKVLGF